MIDLRSDTVTRPTDAMRAAMAAAPVGRRRLRRGSDRRALEARVAALLGHEAGLFCATGSLANVLGVALHVAPGQEVLCDSGAHIARAEMGAHGALTGVTMRTWVTPDGRVTPDRRRGAAGGRTPAPTWSRRPASRSRTPTTSAAARCSRGTR
jgi:threonine aldolase